MDLRDRARALCDVRLLLLVVVYVCGDSLIPWQ